MTSRRPSRARRRRVPAPSLPRPSGAEVGADQSVRRDRTAPVDDRIRVHHVTADYRYVKTDLLTITAVSAVTLGFIVAISYLF